MVLQVELPIQKVILELVLTWNLKGAKMTMTRHVVCNKDHLLAPAATRALRYPRLIHMVQQCKQGATCVGRVPVTLPLRHQGLINGLANHSPTNTLQINVRRSQNLLTVKLADAYVALVLGLSTFTKLLIWTLCARTHEPGSKDVKL